MATQTPDQIIVSLLDNVGSNINTGAFSAVGASLIAALSVIAIVWMGARSALTSASFQETIADATSLFLKIGMTMFIISPTFMTPFLDGFTWLASQASANAGSSLSKALLDMISAAAALFSGESGANTPSLWEQMKAVWDSENFTAGMFALVATYLFKFFTAILILVSALLYAGTYIVTQLMLSIGVMFAPIMVPWMILDPTRGFAEGWLRYMVTAGFQKIVGAMMLAATIGLITQANDIAKANANDVTANFFIYACVMLIAGIMAMLMMQVPAIANAVVSGHATFGFRPPTKMTPGGATTATSRSVQTGASIGTGAAIGAATGAVRGGSRGMAAGSTRGGPIGGAAGGVAGGAMGAARGAMAGAASARSGRGATVGAGRAAWAATGPKKGSSGSNQGGGNTPGKGKSS